MSRISFDIVHSAYLTFESLCRGVSDRKEWNSPGNMSACVLLSWPKCRGEVTLKGDNVTLSDVQ